jgi:hypothetical protein
MTHISNMIVAIYLVLNGCEWFYLGSKTELLPMIGKNAITLRLQDRGWSRFWTRISPELATRIGVRIAAAAMIVSGLALFGTAVSWRTSALISVIAFLSVVAFNVGFSFGLEGADQMATLVLFVNAVTALAPNLQWLTDLFIMSQLILSYGVAGIAKLVSADWRSGWAVGMIVSTRSMGLGTASLLVRNPRAARLACALIIAFELTWFAVPFSKQLAFGLMACGMIFHFSNAWIMGLNLFPWAFVAAYPLAINAIYRLHG